MSPDYDGVGDSFKLSFVQDGDTNFDINWSGCPKCSSWPSRTWGAPKGNVPLLYVILCCSLNEFGLLSTLNANALTTELSYDILTSAAFDFWNGGLCWTT